MKLTFKRNTMVCNIKMKGTLTRDQILNAFDSVVINKNYIPGMARLWDFLDADLSSISTESIMAMAQYSIKFEKGINDVKVAIVINSDLGFGLANMFRAYSHRCNTQIEIYKTIEEAEEWLGQ